MFNDAKVIVHLDTQDDDMIEMVAEGIRNFLSLATIESVVVTDNPCDEVRD